VLLGAKRSVAVTAYTVDHPKVLAILTDLLYHGGKVRVLADSIVARAGSVKHERDFLEKIQEAGTEVRLFCAPKVGRRVTGKTEVEVVAAFAPSCMLRLDSLTLAVEDRVLGGLARATLLPTTWRIL
jgi:hypothetical protein